MSSNRISKRKLANPVQAPPNLGYDDPAREAEARKTRYVDIVLKDLATKDAPVQLWTTERPTSPPSREIVSTSSSDPLSASGCEGSPQVVNLQNYLAKIPTSNDRALRGKLDRPLSPSQDMPVLTLNEPDTPSSLPPRNTLPKNLSPTYVPPGRRGSRAPAFELDDRHGSSGAEAPIVQAPLVKRSYSGTSAQSVHAARRSITLRRTISVDPPTVSQLETAPAFTIEVIPVQPAPTAAKRGRPRKIVPVPVSSSSKAQSISKILINKRVVESPLPSPSTSSITTGPASTADESSLADEDDEDFDDDDDDDNYAPPVSHHKKITARSPPRATANNPTEKAVRGGRAGLSKRGSIDAGVPETREAQLSMNVSSLAAGSPVTLPSMTTRNAGPIMGSFSDRKRNYSDMSFSAHEYDGEPAVQRQRVNKPLTLTLKRSNMSSTVPRLHSPLSQSFCVPLKEGAPNPAPVSSQMYHPSQALSVV